MSNFEGAIAVLRENRTDIESLIEKFGGMSAVIMAAPSLIRIMRTLSTHKDPVQAAEQAGDVLVYSEETFDKVKAFQTKHKINVDGLVGNETWGKVEEIIAAAEAAPKAEAKK